MNELKEPFLKLIKNNSDTPDAEFLAESLSQHVTDSIAKFSKGYTKYHGSLMDRPLLFELKQEIIDSNHYLYGIEYKRNIIVQKLFLIYSANPHLQSLKEILTLLNNL